MGIYQFLMSQASLQFCCFKACIPLFLVQFSSGPTAGGAHAACLDALSGHRRIQVSPGDEVEGMTTKQRAVDNYRYCTKWRFLPKMVDPQNPRYQY